MDNVLTNNRECTKVKWQLSLKHVFCQLRQWRQNYRTRKQLADLPPHLVKDIGLEPDQVNAELRKPFWRD